MAAKFEIASAKAGQFNWVLKSQGRTLATGESYSRRALAERAVESLRKAVAGATVSDLTVRPAKAGAAKAAGTAARAGKSAKAAKTAKTAKTATKATKAAKPATKAAAKTGKATGTARKAAAAKTSAAPRKRTARRG